MKNNCIIAVVPAHNEGYGLRETLESLVKQTNPIDVLVVSDNSTDQTVAIATEFAQKYSQVSVMETVDNQAKKSGALNQGIRSIREKGYQFILTMDADSELAPDLVKIGLQTLAKDQKLAGVSSMAGLKPCPEDTNLWQKMVWHIQHLEYALFDSSRVETLDKVKVLHGMMTIYRAKALFEIADSRKGKLTNQVYNEENIVEDYELTIRLKMAGWKSTANLNMKAWTDVPLSLSELWVQRLRWLRGGVDALREIGWNSVTRMDILGHYLFVFLTAMQLFFFAGIGVALYNNISWIWNPWVIVVITAGWINAMYRLKYVGELTWRDVLIRAVIIPELLYGFWQMAAMLWSYVLSYGNIKQNW